MVTVFVIVIAFVVFIITLALLARFPIGTSICFIYAAESTVNMEASPSPCGLPTASARDFPTHFFNQVLRCCWLSEAAGCSAAAIHYAVLRYHTCFHAGYAYRTG